MQFFPHIKYDKDKLLGKSIYIAGIIGPVVTLDQLRKVWIVQDAEGISVISWVGYLVAAILFMIYGIAHKEKPIIFTYAIWIVLDILMIVGSLLYA